MTMIIIVIITVFTKIIIVIIIIIIFIVIITIIIIVIINIYTKVSKHDNNVIIGWISIVIIWITPPTASHEACLPVLVQFMEKSVEGKSWFCR